MTASAGHPVVHLELHTGDRSRASAFYSELLRLGHGADRRRRAAPTTRSGWAAPSAAGSSSAPPGARCGCPTSRSSASTRSPSARAGSVPRCCSRRARVRRAGAASWPRPRAGRSPSGSPRRGAGWGRMTERELLEAARRGDEAAFGRLVEPHRAALDAHCYRMLGSVQDAEDAVQDALLRAWRGLARFEGRSSLRTWLYTIATNACLKAIERRPAARAPDRLRARHRSPRRARARRSSNRCGSSPTPTSASVSATAWPGPRRATSSARASSSPSSRRCSTCRRASAPC